MSAGVSHGGNSSNPQPATPRMLRSVSSSMKSSAEHMGSSSGRAPASSAQSHASHANQQQQQQHYHQQAAQNTTRDGTGLLPPVTIGVPTPTPTPTHVPAPAPAPGKKPVVSLPQPGKSGHPPASNTANAGSKNAASANSGNGAAGQQQFYRRSIGDWDFVRTIGAGSMGKVKLAKHTATGEKCAVKIVPRAAKLYQRAHARDPPAQSAEEASQRQREFEKEVARDRRTVREGALGRLLYHPHVCRLYEMVPMTNHYYMLFEYVEGGQLLDYIVAHGSLNEPYARKFARGIASALAYCHGNNVVHRDLKIENIMISKDGDIKIIDFGLSNLYTPNRLLKTYCGSLYFAAPELLCAKPYTGPEVDVWSFGVVLYVLVCGKVPFDDPVVSALHEKIKRGNVEYPAFVSRECVSLLSRMLVVDPTKRASLAEVIQHPWMNKGFDHAVLSYTPKRVPLSLPLDPSIVHTIASLDLGSAPSITEELTAIVASPDYQLSADNWYKNSKLGRPPQAGAVDPVNGYHPLVSIYYLVDEMKKRKRAKEEAIKSHMRQQYSDVLPASVGQIPTSNPSAQLARSTSQKQTYAPGQTPSRNSSTNHRMQPQTPGKSGLLETNQLRSPPPPPQQKPPVLLFPEQEHTSALSGSTATDSPVMDKLEQPLQQQQSPMVSTSHSETLDPSANKPAGFNSLLRKMSGKRYKNTSTSPSRESSAAKDSFSARPETPRVSIQAPGFSSPNGGYLDQESPRNKDTEQFVRRGVSMKITAKERSDSRPDVGTEKSSQKNVSAQNETPKYRAHNRSHSTAGRPHGYIPSEYLPPLPNINAVQIRNAAEPGTEKPAKEESSYLQVNTTGFHPTARAKSLGSHARKDSSYYRGGKNSPALPNTMAAQNSDEGVDLHSDTHEVTTFDDVTLDDKIHVHVPQLSEAQIIEQFNNAKRNSMPSIEYPKTLFLKGFFSVQTTSTKPLPVIRYNVLKALSKLGVKFQEVKGGFICVHTDAILAKENTSEEHVTPTASTIIDEYGQDMTSEEKRLYGNAFNSSSGSFQKSKDGPDGLKTPDRESGMMKIPSIVTPQQPATKLSRQGSVHGNGPASPTNSTKGHRSSNSMSHGHRRKFSIGQTFLQNYRKKNGSQTLMPPNTPAAAKINRLLTGDGDIDDGDLDEETLTHMRKLSYDDSMDSVNGELAGGGSDMLISSRIEQRARHQRSNSVFSEDEAQKKIVGKTPLKFEINIVKVPLVGLYGVQFKKTLGNTWSYKSLASQIMNELNL